MKNILIKGLFVSIAIALTTSSVSALTCTNLTKSLSKYSENSEVLKLQQFLFDGGYLTVKPNGYYGNGTVAAVKKFQKANELSQLGSVGPGTRGKIKEVSCGNILVNDQQKQKDVNSIANALKEFAGDHSGKLPVYALYKDEQNMGSETGRAISSNFKEICANKQKDCSSYADLSELVPKYLSTLPISDGKRRENGTGYYVKKEGIKVIVSTTYVKEKESVEASVIYTTKELENLNKGKIVEPQVVVPTKSYESPVVKEDFVVDLTAPKPTLTVSASPIITEPNTESLISWRSSNTVWCSVVGKGQGFGRGADKVKRKSNDEQGIIVGNSLLTATVTCKGRNGDLVSKEVLVRVKSPNEPAQSQKQNESGVKRYEMYMSRNLTMVSYLTESEALDHCVNISHKNNPKSSIECMWGDKKIYSFMGESDLKFFKSVGIE